MYNFSNLEVLKAEPIRIDKEFDTGFGLDKKKNSLSVSLQMSLIYIMWLL